MITWTLILFVISPGGYLRIEKEDTFSSLEDCRKAGMEAVKLVGGYEKARFHCKEVANERK